MMGVVFTETLRRGWRSMAIWGVSIGLMALLVVIIVPNVQALQQMAELMETLPPFLTQALGGGDAAFMATPEGYLALQYFGYMMLIFAVYAVVGGLNVTANDEDRGILDVFLSLPIPRWQLVLEKFLGFALLIIGVVVISFGGMWLGIILTPALSVDMGKIVAATINIVPGSLFMLAFTLFVAAVVRRRTHAMAIAAVLVVGSYFLDAIGRAAPGTVVDTLRFFSFYRYYDGSTVLQYGLSFGNIALLLGATVILLLGGMWFFQRRDVGL